MIGGMTVRLSILTSNSPSLFLPTLRLTRFFPGIALLMIPTVLAGQGTGFVVGTVVGRASGVESPLALAVVEVPSASLRTFTDSAGAFTLVSVPAGRVVVRAGVIGYATAERTVRVRDGDTTVVRFALDPAVLITPMVVTARA